MGVQDGIFRRNYDRSIVLFLQSFYVSLKLSNIVYYSHCNLHVDVVVEGFRFKYIFSFRDFVVCDDACKFFLKDFIVPCEFLLHGDIRFFAMPF